MHEWALAEAVVESAVRTAAREGLRSLAAAEVRVGELQQIDREAFEMALGVLARERSGLGEVTFQLESEPAELRCRACEHDWLLAESLAMLPFEEREAIHFLPETVHGYVQCPRCASPDYAVVRGRGVSLVAVTGSREEA